MPVPDIKDWLHSAKITKDEGKLLAERRNEQCKAGNHLKMEAHCPNGRDLVWCRNCLWAELVDCSDDDLKIGQVSLFGLEEVKTYAGHR